MSRVLGITGGIGAGKSRICSVFAEFGCKVYDSDARTKQLYADNRQLQSGLVEILGKDILKDGVLDRKAMANLIFSDKLLMAEVKKLVYPFVMADFVGWKRYKRGVVVFESAVILENEYVRSFMDKVLVVTAPLDLRIRRVMKRDTVSEAEVRRRLENQISDEQRISMADFVIESIDGNDIEGEVRNILKKMK